MGRFGSNIRASWWRTGRVFQESGIWGGGLRVVARLAGGGVRRRLNQAPALYHLMAKRTADLITPNARFRDRHRDCAAFVVATGPSVEQQDLSRLRNGIVIGVNENFAYLQSRDVPIAYNIVQDDGYFDGSPGYGDFWRDFGKAARAIGMTPVVPTHAAAAIAADPIWTEVNPAYFLQVGEFLAVAQEGRSISLDFTAPLPAFLTTTHAAIAWAMFLGCPEIHVLGVDLDHFENIGRPMRHCYGGNPYNDHDRSSAEESVALNARVPAFDLQVQSFDKLANIAWRRGQRIVDAGLRGRAGTLPKAPLPTLARSGFSPSLARREV